MNSEFDTRAVVGVLLQGEKFLVIKRSQQVIAPGKLCFPGGKIEENESVKSALQREFQEEIRLPVLPLKQVWESVTSWACLVHWWLVTSDETDLIEPNRQEVDAIAWMTASELLSSETLLESNRYFLNKVESGEISLLGGAEGRGET